jgi:hypothetical protein
MSHHKSCIHAAYAQSQYLAMSCESPATKKLHIHFMQEVPLAVLCWARQGLAPAHAFSLLG